MEAPIVITEETNPIVFSLGASFGSVKTQGKEYMYLQEQKALVRKDKVQEFQIKHIKQNNNGKISG